MNNKKSNNRGNDKFWFKNCQMQNKTVKNTQKSTGFKKEVARTGCCIETNLTVNFMLKINK